VCYVYILRSETTGRFYVGCTEDLVRRLEEHSRGQTASTLGRGPWTLVYQEQHDSFQLGLQRERQIKSWQSSKAISRLIAERASR
jgi:putative endonuclease